MPAGLNMVHLHMFIVRMHDLMVKLIDKQIQVWFLFPHHLAGGGAYRFALVCQSKLKQ